MYYSIISVWIFIRAYSYYTRSGMVLVVDVPSSRQTGDCNLFLFCYDLKYKTDSRNTKHNNN